MKKLRILTLVVLTCAFSFAQSNKITTTNTVTFTADISAIIGTGLYAAFNPQRDSLLVEGLDWDGETTVVGNRMMFNPDSLNPGIYKTTLLVSSTLDSVRWKFRAGPYYLFPNAGWETGIDRWLVVGVDSSNVTLDTIIPRILTFIQLTTGAHLLFTLDVSGAKNRYNGLTIPLNEIEFIGLKGNKEYLGSLTEGCWCADDTASGTMKLLRKINDSTWNFHHELPGGTLIDTLEYQFCIMYPGADTINGGVEPLANEFSLGINHNYILNQEYVMFINNSFGDPNPVGVERIENLVLSGYQLEQNYPNPFNPTTKIRYSIPEIEFVSLKIVNLLGQEIEVIVNQEQTARVYEATFDASSLASGIYFYTLSTKNYSITKKMLLVR